MFNRIRTFALLLAAPLMLVGCVIAPGKFASTLDIRADRSFTFTYKGEVIGIDLASDMAKDFGNSLNDPDGGDEDDGDDPDSEMMSDTVFASFVQEKNQGGMTDDGADDATPDAEQQEAKYRAVADALRKEPGYRSVEYKGDGVFAIDYSISGKLAYNFVYPYNLDAEIIFPFVVIELRGKDTVRVKAPAFAQSQQSSNPMLGGEKVAERLDGTFTLTTDAEIVSQNNEDGATTNGTTKTIRWTATPLTKDAPAAVLRLAPLAP